MRLDEHLVQQGVDRSLVMSSISEAIGPRWGDVVLAVGSVAEGLGNSKSDLDLLLVTGEDTWRAESERCWAIGRCVVDLRVLHSATIERLADRLGAWARRPWSIADSAPFSYEERVLLHRLMEGVKLYPASGPEDYPWQPRRPELARLKLQVARHTARTVQVDMVGYRDEHDYGTLVFAAQDLLGHGVDGLLAGHYLTNPNPKWRLRLLRRLPLDWDRPLRMRPTGLRADQAFWDLHQAPAEPARDPAVAYALRCISFARVAFAWAEERLFERPVPDGGLRARELCRRAEGQPLPGLEFDVDFAFTRTGIAVARLNEFEATLRLSEREFALFLLLDGQTSIDEAQAIVNDALADGAEPLDVDEVLGRVIHSGLCLQPTLTAGDD
jgi:hypothetical protein